MNDIKVIKSLAAKLCLIMSECSNIEKKGFNSVQNYKFIREADVSDAIRKLLATHGVFCLPSVEDISEHEIESRSGAKGTYIRAKVKYTFINAEDPNDKLEAVHYGDGSDFGDKGLYKALTGCHKYMMLRTFCLGSEEDPENEAKSDNGFAKTSVKTTTSGNPPPVNGDVITFGKHKGTRWDAVNTNYLEWLSEQKEGPTRTRAMMELHRRKQNQPPPGPSQEFVDDDLPWNETPNL